MFVRLFACWSVVLYYHCNSKNSHTLLDDCFIIVDCNEVIIVGIDIMSHI
nr:MAG TPA: hypothetical protein [Crassvirales sp.]